MTDLRRNILLFFILALSVQLGILFSFQFSRQSGLDQGRRILVRAIPVDPRDLFRGDYVTLSYGFSRIDRTHVKESLGPDLPRGVKVYVKLQPAVDAQGSSPAAASDWRAMAVSRRPFPRLASNEVMLAGYLSDHSPEHLNITYGCESYFVPEGKGRPIEASVRVHQVTVELSITPKGAVQLAKLFVNGKEVNFQEEPSAVAPPSPAR